MSIAIIIPVHNEAPHIAEVIRKAKKYGTVFVIDDGSTDTTAILARSSGAEVYCHPNNLGVGAALRTGFAVAKKFDIVVTADGDGQHDLDDMPKLLNAIKGADVVIGSRFLKGIKIPPYRRLGIWVITFAYNFGHKTITDSQSGFRAYSRKFLDSVELEENGFGSITEILIKARKMGFKIAEVPISCSYRSLGQDSHMNPLRHGLLALWKTIYWRIKECN
jgi:glycosyltransferase involved in cell wall biosynthesis